MDFALTPRMLEMQSHLQVFLDRHILPANVEWNREVEVVGISQRRLCFSQNRTVRTSGNQRSRLALKNGLVPALRPTLSESGMTSSRASGVYSNSGMGLCPPG
jgi:hypothetical protein